MRFIATADWQLGMTAHYLDDEARPRYREARFEAIRRVGQLAVQRDADFVVVCGDVFESNQLDRKILLKTFDVLQEFPCPVHLLPGNHDHLGPGSIYDSKLFVPPPNVSVIRSDKPTVLETEPRFELIGIPWYSKTPTTDLLNDVLDSSPDPEPDMFRLVCAHGGVSSLSANESPDIIDIERLRKNIAHRKADFVLLGDRHSTTEVIPNVWYPGTPEVTSRTEEQPGNVLVITIDPASRNYEIEPVHVGKWVFGNLLTEINDDDDAAQLIEDLENLRNKATTALWFGLKGSVSTETSAHLDAELNKLRELFAHLEPWERNMELTVAPEEGEFSNMNLSGFAKESLDQLINLANSGLDDASTATDALNLLFRFAKEVQ